MNAYAITTEMCITIITVVSLTYASGSVELEPSERQVTRSSTSDAEVSLLPPTATNSSLLCPSACQCTLAQALAGSIRRTASCDRPIDNGDNFDPETEAVYVTGNCHRSFVSVITSAGALTTLRELSLQRCHLYTVEELLLAGDAVNWGTVFSVDVGFNLMTRVVSRAFIKMSALQTLILKHNRVETIEEDAFDGLDSLKILDMTGNRLSMVTREDMRWICPLRSLDELSLRDNGVHVLAASAFLCRPQPCPLRQLDLGANRIRRVETEAFAGLSNLTRMNLDGSQLTSVPSTALTKLSASLEELDMSGNQLRALLTDSFHDLTDLLVLRLNRMSTLRFVDRKCFVNMTSLERVELSGNAALNYVDRESFFNTPNITHISLSGGGLEALEGQLVETLTSLKSFDLRRNPIKCDCHTKWMRLSNVTLVNQDVGRECDDDPLDSGCSPRIAALVDAHLNVALTDAFTLYCRAVGFPPPQITWMVPPSLNRNSSFVQVSVAMVTVKAASSRDSGNYTCIATNVHGSDSLSVSVDVIKPPTVIIVSRLTPTSVTLIWKHVEHTRAYRLTYRALSAPYNDTTDGADSSPINGVDVQYYMRSYTLAELRPDTPYCFCISVRPASEGVDYTVSGSEGGTLWTVDCVKATTPSVRDIKVGLTNIRHFVTFACTTVVGVALLVCVMGARRHCSRHADWPPEVSDAGSSGRLSPTLQYADSAADYDDVGGVSAGWNELTDEVYENSMATTSSSLVSIFNAADLDEIRRTAVLNCTTAT